MITETGTDQPRGYRQMAFSNSVRSLQNARRRRGATRRATLPEVLAVLATARDQLPGLAPDHVVGEVLAHNPDVVQLLDGEEAQASRSCLAFLPLNSLGLAILVSGGFDYARPDLSHICRQGEQPIAIYVWLVFAPGRFMTTVLALDPLLARLAPAGCALFARPANAQAASLFAKLGFRSAVAVYASAPQDLIGLPPVSGFPEQPMQRAAAAPTLRVRVARTMDDVVKSFSIRSATYISEQFCPFDEEFDGNDFCATHLIGEIEGEPAGCIRVRFFADFVKIERLAVRQEYRTSKLAFRLVREALHYARKKGYRRAYGHSRTDLTRFWGLFGFRPLPDRTPFVFSDVEYVELQADLGEERHVIAIGADPYVLIRPEGEWDQPGPLDRSAQRHRQRQGA